MLRVLRSITVLEKIAFTVTLSRNPGPRNSPVYIQSLPEHCLRLKKIKKKILTKELLKNTQ